MKLAAIAVVAMGVVTPAAHAQFIATSIQIDDLMVGFTDVPCEHEVGFKVLRARGNWMQSGCYSEVPGAAMLIHWQATDPTKQYDPSTYERIGKREIEPTATFRGWPRIQPDATQPAAKYQSSRK